MVSKLKARLVLLLAFSHPSWRHREWHFGEATFEDVSLLENDIFEESTNASLLLLIPKILGASDVRGECSMHENTIVNFPVSLLDWMRKVAQRFPSSPIHSLSKV